MAEPEARETAVQEVQSSTVATRSLVQTSAKRETTQAHAPTGIPSDNCRSGEFKVDLSHLTTLI